MSETLAPDESPVAGSVVADEWDVDQEWLEQAALDSLAAEFSLRPDGFPLGCSEVPEFVDDDRFSDEDLLAMRGPVSAWDLVGLTSIDPAGLSRDGKLEYVRRMEALEALVAARKNRGLVAMAGTDGSDSMSDRHVAMEVAQLRRVGEGAAASGIATARALHVEFPKFLAALEAGEVSEWHCRVLVSETVHVVDPATIVALQERLLPKAKRTTPGRFRTEVRKAVADLDALGLPADDHRRRLLLLANPLSDEQPGMRTTLVPGLLATLRRNVGRGTSDVALFESGAVVRLRDGQGERGVTDPPRPSVAGRPSDTEVSSLEALLPDQPLHVAVALAGGRTPDGWWGDGAPAGWADAIEAARLVARAVGVELEVRRGSAPAPWHPGRCAELVLDGEVVGYAGEVAPKACETAGLPKRTAVMELDLGALIGAAVEVVTATPISTYPVAKEDVALVVASDVPASAVEAALVSGAGPLLESVRLFDVYAGEQVGEGRKSLAYALRFRAPDRTLKVDEVAAARDSAVAAATASVGAVLRG